MELNAIAAAKARMNVVSSADRQQPIINDDSAGAEHERLNGTRNDLGISRRITVEDILKEMVDSVRIALRDFVAENMKPHPQVGFRHDTGEPPNLTPVLEQVGQLVEHMEGFFDELAAVGPSAVGARAMILNIKMPLKLFMLEMASLPDTSAISRGDAHSVVHSCIALEQEMSARLIEMDLAILKQDVRKGAGPRAA